MVLLSTTVFKEQMNKKYNQNFDVIPVDEDLSDLLVSIKHYLDIDVYVKLLSYIDMIEYYNFQRFFLIAIRNFYSTSVELNDIENIKDDLVLQLMFIICLQYYFL